MSQHSIFIYSCEVDDRAEAICMYIDLCFITVSFISLLILFLLNLQNVNRQREKIKDFYKLYLMKIFT